MPASASIYELLDDARRRRRRGFLLGDRAGSTFVKKVEPTDLKSNRSARLRGGRMSLGDSA
jgi:hypothetical protein